MGLGDSYDTPEWLHVRWSPRQGLYVLEGTQKYSDNVPLMEDIHLKMEAYFYSVCHVLFETIVSKS